ncbi:MAG: phage holin family protein [Burkholderiales bacterium]|nr:phage holin family protein [Burkholderiales bacterium]
MDSSPSTGLLTRLQGIAALGLELLQTRLELIGNELQIEVLLAFDALVRGAAGLLMLIFGVFFLTTFLVALVWDSYRLLALAAAATLFIGVGGLFLMEARRRLQRVGNVFAASLAELKRDREQFIGKPPA